MMKKYTSKSDIAISVLLESQKSVHVAFCPITGGGSVYYTDDDDLQKALEHHPKFGRLFKLDSEIDNDSRKPTPASAHPSFDETMEDGTRTVGANGGCEIEKSGDGQTAEEDGVPSNLMQVHVDNLDDAKEYLCDHFGISRTKLRSQKSIVEAGAANGIEFIGIGRQTD